MARAGSRFCRAFLERTEKSPQEKTLRTMKTSPAATPFPKRKAPLRHDDKHAEGSQEYSRHLPSVQALGEDQSAEKGDGDGVRRDDQARHPRRKALEGSPLYGVVKKNPDETQGRKDQGLPEGEKPELFLQGEEGKKNKHGGSEAQPEDRGNGRLGYGCLWGGKRSSPQDDREEGLQPR
ncbi:hypothetical protein MASR2M79_09790 [Aminivibrio sp.]